MFNVLPTFDATEYYERAAVALSKAGMAIDINTGTRYRYPIKKISPPPEFMEVAARHGLPIITSSDAHQPEDCGRFIDEAIDYARSFGYKTCLRFTRRQREEVPLG